MQIIIVSKIPYSSHPSFSSFGVQLAGVCVGAVQVGHECLGGVSDLIKIRFKYIM